MNREKDIFIGTNKIGENNPVFIIAELSANHNQDFEIAKKTITAIKETGADAIKFQTYTADTITLDCKNDHFKIKSGTIWDGRFLHELYKQAYTPWEWQPELKAYAESIGLVCFSSPFDKTAVDFLEKIAVPAYKIASFEITDIPLIEYTAAKNKPIIISTGIADIEDIRLAIKTCQNVGNEQIILLKCTSAYPAQYDEMNLLTIPDMANKFNTIVGLSDHSLGSEIAIAAVSCGAKIIEKHFILDRKIGGPDASFSMEPKEFKKMVSAIRNVEKALGKPTYALSNKMQEARSFSRSLFAVKDIKKGEVITEENIKSIRPGNGLHPKHLKELIGKVAKTEILRGTPINTNHFHIF
jgi:pseudaminic acid synthase